jgi:hypothetical protein
MELEIIMLREVSQIQKDKYLMFLHMWNLDYEKKKRHEGERSVWKGGEIRESNKGGVNMIKAHYIHVWESHNETQYYVQLIYASKNGPK